jgi:hypothetical protein
MSHPLLLVILRVIARMAVFPVNISPTIIIRINLNPKILITAISIPTNLNLQIPTTAISIPTSPVIIMLILSLFNRLISTITVEKLVRTKDINLVFISK